MWTEILLNAQNPKCSFAFSWEKRQLISDFFQELFLSELEALTFLGRIFSKNSEFPNFVVYTFSGAK